MSDHSENVAFIPLAGKGLGMVALKDIQVGETVYREKPLIWMPDSVFQSELHRIERWLDKAINRLTSPQRSDFYELSDCRNPEDKTTLGIFFTNCMTFIEGSTALFPNIARANHSCCPNAEFFSRKNLEAQDLVAIQPIKKGDEISIDYVPAAEEGSSDTQTRREYLIHWYGFRCVCWACTNGEGEKDRRQIMDLKAIGPLEQLNAYQLEQLVDNLDRIKAKVDFRERMNALLFDKAVSNNDQILAAKAFSSVLLHKTIKSCPNANEWKTSYENSQATVINGRWYLFPPDM